MMRRMQAIGLCAMWIMAGWAAPVWGQTPPNVRLNSDTSPYLQNEEQVWVNLTDSLNVVADWRDWRLGYRRVGVGVSSDGGATWSDSLIVGIYDRQSDPCLVGDANGTFYMNALDYSSTGISSTISVWRSLDGGQSWSTPVAAVPLSANFEDKQFTAVDRTGGLRDGSYYFSWTRFPNNGSPSTIQFVRSLDGGQTFSSPLTIGHPVVSDCGQSGAGQSSIPIVESNGAVHVFWQGVVFDTLTCNTEWAIKHTVSTSGGVFFGGVSTLWTQRLGWGNVDGPIDVYGFVTGDADISGGPYDGAIYLSQTYQPTTASETDVVVRKSTDHGVTWSTPTTVNDDAPGQNIDQFHPWLIVNEDGTVMMIFYDQRNDPLSHYMFDCYYSASFDGGETFIRNYRLSSVSSTPDNLAAVMARGSGEWINPGGGDYPLLSPMEPMAGRIAEYIGVHAKHDWVVAVWTDTRDGTQDVYSARFETPFLAPRLYFPADGTVSQLVDTTFRWSTCWHEADDAYRLEVSTDSTFGTIDFVYAGLVDNELRPDPALPEGDYFWRVRAFRSAGDSTEYSEVYSLRLGCTGGAAPSLVSPGAGDTLETAAVALDWTDVGGAVSYDVQVSTLADFSVLAVDTSVVTSDLTVNLADSTHYYWRVSTTDECGTGSWSAGDFVVETCPVDLTGDVNVTGTLTSADVIYLVTFVFKGGPAPQPVMAAGDVNCDEQVTSADVIYLVNYIFKGGPPPCDVCELI